MPQPNELALLQHLVANIEQHPNSSFEHSSSITGFISASGGYTGIRHAATRSFHKLTELLLKSKPKYMRETTFEELKRPLLSIIFEHCKNQSQEITNADLENIKAKIENWFNKMRTPSIEILIPCELAPYPIEPFNIGPVNFLSQDQIEAKAREASPFERKNWHDWIKAASNASANCVAEVSISGHTERRAWETARLALDLAITTIQLITPPDSCRNMTRIDGKRKSAFQNQLALCNGKMHFGFHNNRPGRTFPQNGLAIMLDREKPLLFSAGNRIQSFISGESPLPRLEQAWADATYWFHEGFTDELDTTAVPKLETSIEVLLRAESSKGSKGRIIKAIEIFCGFKAHDIVQPHNITAEKFADELVTDRSRILHGTLSTLNHSMLLSRKNLEQIAREFLIKYTFLLDLYIQSEQPADDLNKFFEWILAACEALKS